MVNFLTKELKIKFLWVLKCVKIFFTDFYTFRFNLNQLTKSKIEPFEPTKPIEPKSDLQKYWCHTQLNTRRPGLNRVSKIEISIDFYFNRFYNIS